MTEREIRNQALRLQAARANTRAAQRVLRLAVRRTAGSPVGMGVGVATGMLIGRSWRCQGPARSGAGLWNRLRALAPLLVWMNR